MKKVLILVLGLVLMTAITSAGTIAYLSDTDSDVNVMTLGRVKIDQVEYERDANGALQEFSQSKPLLPAVGSAERDMDQAWNTIGAPGSDKLYGAGLKNVLDKFVFVKSTNNGDAYVRTLIALEQGSIDAENYESIIATNTNTTAWTWAEPIKDVEIGDSTYVVLCATYAANEGILKAKAMTEPSLLQIYMQPEATNDDVDAIDGNKNGTFDVLVLSQAVQADGFAGAAAALEAGFGDFTADNAASWLGNLEILDYTIPAAEVVDGVVELKAGEARVLSGKYENTITVKGNGTLHLRNLTIDAASGDAIAVEGEDVKLIAEGSVKLTGEGSGIKVPAGAKLDLSGNALTAVGGAGEDSTNGGHGIGGEGEIYIHDLKSLTAKGFGVNGFGIGGESMNVKIENTTIKHVQGGYVQPNFVSDTSYGKSEPEGGAAIGSNQNGAVITLNKVVIENAEGGSKSAAIGARYHTGVTINITNSEIKNAQGGNASAGIGGSRVSGDKLEGEKVTINIKDSTVTAKGGEFAAGIGAGYDTHCNPGQPVCTINITGDSVINATGGKYGAGIGTGYHMAALAGEIEDTVTVNAIAGESREKYTEAMGVGFGVIDKTREADSTNTSSFNYKGTVITVASAPDVQ